MRTDIKRAGSMRRGCGSALRGRRIAGASGTHFTCFTGTKVQILTQKGAANRPVIGDDWAPGAATFERQTRDDKTFERQARARP